MEKMKSLVVLPEGRLELWEIDVPQPKPHQALVKTISGGICGTDSTLVAQSFKGVDPNDYPLALGHESVGRVVEVGEAVRSFGVGDVVMLPFVPEPTCDGQVLGSAWGAFSEFALVDDLLAPETADGDGPGEASPAQSVVPEDIDPVHAPVMVTLREVLSSIRVSGVDLSEPIAVVGSGPVAMMFVKLLKLLGADTVVAVVRSEAKAALMAEFGADACLDTSERPLNESTPDVAPDGFGAIIDAVGSPDVINEALGLVQDRGIVFVYGVPKKNSMNLDWDKAPYNWTLKFQQMPRKDEEGACHEQIVEWVRQGSLVLRDFVSEVVPITQAPEFFRDYLAGGTQRKIIFEFEH